MSTVKLEPILEGYLKKQSPKGLLVKPWQERYFVLQPNGEILYYASHQSMSEVTGRIKLRTVTDISISKKNGCQIEIQALKKGSPRNYLLMANNSSDARMWLDNIEDVRRKCEESDKQSSRPKTDIMSMAFKCPSGDVMVMDINANRNMYEVKADLFATAVKLRRPISGVPEDYLVVLETEDPELATFFLEDIRGELGQHPYFTKAFAEKQTWKAVVKPLSEMSELKQQLERQRSTSQEIEILVGRSASSSAADSLYLSEVIRSRSRSSSQEKGTWTLPIAETAPHTWAPGTIQITCSYPKTVAPSISTMDFGLTPLEAAVNLRDVACRPYLAALNLQEEPCKFALKLGGLNVFADTRDGSQAKIGDYKIVQHAASLGEPVLVGLVRIPLPSTDDEAEFGAEPAAAADPIPPSLAIPWTEWQFIPSTLLKLQFKLKIGEVMISSADSQLKKLGTRDSPGSMFMTAGLYYGGETLTNDCLLQTSATYGCATPRWNEWLVFPLAIGSLPQATRLCFSLFHRDASSSNTARDTPLGWVSLQLMDHKGVLVVGRKKLRLWPDGPANAIGTCMDNSGSDSPGALYIQFDDSPLPSVFSQESARVAPEPAEMPIPEGRKASASVFGASPFASGTQFEPQLRAEESLRLQDALRADLLTLPTEEERRILWKARSSLKGNVRALYKVIHSVPWSSRKAVFEARQLLTEWAVPAPLAALQLLNAQFGDPEVRKYAVNRLRELDDAQLQNFVLQLVQVLKYEAYHNSEVAQFLLERAVGNRTIGHQIFWHLQAELHVATIKDRYSLILSAYLRCCGSSLRKEFLKQTDLVKKLCAVADAIKVVKGEGERMALIRKMLTEIQFPDKVILPLDPRFEVSGLFVDKCRFMDSKKLPLWLVFQNADPQGAPIYVIFKSGDDLRQDMLTLQMIRIMDKLWQQQGLDLGLNAYSCMATGDEMGMLQVVLNAETTSAISKAAGGSSACFREDPVANWLRQHNSTPEKYAKAVENFTRSCAGYCVATCVLGIGDRHNDNIMLQRTGFLFHIDFGHFLGNFKSKFGFRRERAKFVFTPDFAYVLGGVGGEPFKRFEQLCAQAFNALRKEADLFINLFALMLSSGIPELQTPEDIHYLRDAFLLDLNDEDAGKEFMKWIHESLNTRSTQINNAIHTWAHS